MSRPDLVPLAVEERADLLALLRQLTPDQWQEPSLCSGWRVRDVAAHVVSFDDLSNVQTMATFLRGGLRPGRVNEVALDRYRTLEPAAIIEMVTRHQRPHGLPSGLGGGIALTDGTIHHQDIRRALGLQRVIPPHRLLPVLEFSLRAPTLPSRRNRRGLRLVATDLDWTNGEGHLVSGPGEALLMALAGRPQAFNELGGDGLDTLVQRVTRARHAKPRS